MQRMAKITTGPALAEVRGKIGDTVLTRTRGGKVAKALSLAATDGTTPHNLLSTTHPDTTPGSPARGDLITGQTATPKWKRLAKGTPGQVLGCDADDAMWTNPPATGVTSVGLALPAHFTVTGSPVTTAGTLTGAWNNQDANKVLAGPTSGPAAAPTFRLLAAADIPLLDGSRVYNSADLTIGTGAEATLTFNSERYDNGGLHESVTNPSRFTVKQAGLYAITASILWDSAPAGARGLYLKKNATTLLAQEYERHAVSDYCAQAIATICHLNANDYVQVIVIQTAGVNVKILTVAETSPEFSIQLLAAI